MRPEERLHIARRTYRQAVALAREAATPAAWARLLTAARNLSTAVRDRDRRLPGTGGARAGAPVALAPPRETSVPLLVPGGDPLRRPRLVVGEGPQRPSGGRWPELERELLRAHTLMERSRQLVAQARALRAHIAVLDARWRRIASRWPTRAARDAAAPSTPAASSLLAASIPP